MDKIEKLNGILSAFKVPATCRKYSQYKNASFYDIELKPGGRIRDLEKYADEFALALKTHAKPRINVLSSTGLIRFEFLSEEGNKVSLLDLGQKAKRPKGDLTCLMGETLSGEPLWIDLAQNPHMLVAGCTGSGKSTVLHTVIANLLMYPTIKIHLMDPKSIEFFKYQDKKVSRINVSYSFEECIETLQHLNDEMDNRYSQAKEYKKDMKSFPFIALIIDEFADLKMQDADGTFHKLLCRLAQKSRAARIHIVLATQRPSVQVVDGLIKANFPARLSCKVASGVDSKVVLDFTGAQDLQGGGDAIINNTQHSSQRFQVAYTNADEVCDYFDKYAKRSN